MDTVHSEQADPKLNHIRMACRACVQLLLNVYGVDTSIDTEMLKTPKILLSLLVDLDNGRKPYIGILRKDRQGIFSEFHNKIFKYKFLHYVNEVLFLNGKTALKDTYIGGITPTALQTSSIHYGNILR